MVEMMQKIESCDQFLYQTMCLREQLTVLINVRMSISGPSFLQEPAPSGFLHQFKQHFSVSTASSDSSHQTLSDLLTDETDAARL